MFQHGLVFFLCLLTDSKENEGAKVEQLAENLKNENAINKPKISLIIILMLINQFRLLINSSDLFAKLFRYQCALVRVSHIAK